MSDPTWSLEFNKGELELLRALLEVRIKEMDEDDPYRMGVRDPDRESDLQELRELHDKVYGALIELGRRVPPSELSCKRLANEPVSRGRYGPSSQPAETA